MRKFLIIVTFILIALGVLLTILPTEKLGLLPIIGALILSIIATKKSDISNIKLPKFLIIITTILLVIALAKIAMTKDEVVIDQKDEAVKIESQKQDQKDLEALDGLE